MQEFILSRYEYFTCRRGAAGAWEGERGRGRRRTGARRETRTTCTYNTTNCIRFTTKHHKTFFGKVSKAPSSSSSCMPHVLQFVVACSDGRLVREHSRASERSPKATPISFGVDIVCDDLYRVEHIGQIHLFSLKRRSRSSRRRKADRQAERQIDREHTYVWYQRTIWSQDRWWVKTEEEEEEWSWSISCPYSPTYRVCWLSGWLAVRYDVFPER